MAVLLHFLTKEVERFAHPASHVPKLQRHEWLGLKLTKLVYLPIAPGRLLAV